MFYFKFYVLDSLLIKLTNLHLEIIDMIVNSGIKSIIGE